MQGKENMIEERRAGERRRRGERGKRRGEGEKRGEKRREERRKEEEGRGEKEQNNIHYRSEISSSFSNRDTDSWTVAKALR